MLSSYFSYMNIRLSCLCFFALLSCWALAQDKAISIAQVDLQAISELEVLAVEYDEPKSLLEVTNAYPVAEVHGKVSVGFLGKLEDGVTESDWRTWAAGEDAVTAGACRDGIASFRVDAYELEKLWEVPMELVEIASRAVPYVNKVRYGTRVDSVHAGFNLPQPYHGEGVLIGFLIGDSITLTLCSSTQRFLQQELELFGISTDKQVLHQAITDTGLLQNRL